MHDLKSCPFCQALPVESPHWRGHYGCPTESCTAFAANLIAEEWNERVTNLTLTIEDWLKDRKVRRPDFQQWAVVAWPTHSGCDYQLLTGRYKTRAGANLAADCAAKVHQRTMMVVTVLRHNEDIV